MPIRINTLEELASQDGPLHLALGVFDGIHVGHQVVIDRAVSAAREQGGRAFVVTFSPHPIRVIAPGKAPKSLLATLDEKAEVVKALGVDGLLVICFDAEFAKMTAEAFVSKLTAGNIATVSVGEDWRFGSKRLGDVEMLRQAGKVHGFNLEAVPPVMWDGERISSTRIRQAIRDGNFSAAESMLGRPYEVTGKVIEGRRLGRQIGFPTANLSLGDLQIPQDGVWAVTVDGKMKGIANLGMRPTVGGSEKLLEVHLFDFSGDLYGKTIRVRFDRYIRAEQKFASVDDLKQQIGRDVISARS
ncbi:bifunctional riboflavin kinase/FAD synthetase [Luteolibacter sp. AS25]|uniref:bifunctional riboflavin kinase/FAD synthetase n=1 Tax=Luteolibacter sp. AS25 TaxID=3135776 RepID=UPI00398BB107